MWSLGHLQRRHLPTKFHEIHRSIQKLLVGEHTHTDGQAGDLISVLQFLESKLKTTEHR
jgi:hypothetical protein